MALANAKLIMVIRHGEKINDKLTDLSPRGKARAYCLTSIFGSTYPAPQKIFAQNPTEKKQSTRPRDTVVPLAEALGLQVDLSYTSGQIKKLTNYIASSNDEVTLVSWNNDKIPEIAEKLGISNPPDWDSDTFDDIWMIYDNASSYNFNGNNVVKRAVYAGEGYTMEIVKQNIDTCINDNIKNYSNVVSSQQQSSGNSNDTSGSNKLNSSLIMMVFSLFVSAFILFY
jgi:broad specificity phosphatase PhoE